MRNPLRLTTLLLLSGAIACTRPSPPTVVPSATPQPIPPMLTFRRPGYEGAVLTAIDIQARVWALDMASVSPRQPKPLWLLVGKVDVNDWDEMKRESEQVKHDGRPPKDCPMVLSWTGAAASDSWSVCVPSKGYFRASDATLEGRLSLRFDALYQKAFHKGQGWWPQ